MRRNGIDYTIRLNHWLPKLLGHDATTICRTIYVAAPTLDAGLHCHEFTHCEQFCAQPWTFYPRFLWAARRGYPKAPRYDTGNPYEVQAYQRELDPHLVATFASYP